MLFRRRKTEEQEQGGGVATAPADSAQILEEIEELQGANRESADPETERRLLRLRHQAGARLLAEADGAEYPDPAFDQLPDGPGVPEVAAAELTPELVRAALLRNGCVIARNYIPAADAESLIGVIEQAHANRAALRAEEPVDPAYYEEFVPEPEFGYPIGREWVSDSDLWASDSPKVMFEMLETLERAGLRKLVTGYLGERPTLSIEKCTLRKVPPDSRGMWHQDGAFLGDVRALNVWIALSHCGDEAPGLDLIPRRFEELVPTGTYEFDWAVSDEVAENAAGDAPIVRPIFEPGDLVLFDELNLHRTAVAPEMTKPRYAIESWFFGPSAFPGEYSPVAF